MQGIRRMWLGALVVLAACAAAGPLQRVRTLDAQGPYRFHRPVTLQVGWQSYTEQPAATDGDATDILSDSLITGSLPVLVLHYLDDAERIVLPMRIDDALLGRLIKATAMTEIPVEEPLADYLERVDCAHCHPPTVPLD